MQPKSSVWESKI